jgi:hypothetical protein
MSSKQQSEHTRHGHPLPQVRSAATYFLRGTALVLALSVVGLVVNIALGGDSAITSALAAVEIIVLICVIFAAFSQREAKRAIPRILTDHQTIHWTYNPQEWQRFSAQAWRRSIRVNLTMTGIAFAIVVVLLVIGIASSNGEVDIPAALALGAGIVALIGALLFAQSALQLLWRRRQTTLSLYLHPTGFILNGWYSGLNWTVGGRKKIVYTPGDPGILAFNVGSGRGARTLMVPVPQGREAQAEEVAHGSKFYIR